MKSQKRVAFSKYDFVDGAVFGPWLVIDGDRSCRRLQCTTCRVRLPLEAVTASRTTRTLSQCPTCEILASLVECATDSSLVGNHRRKPRSDKMSAAQRRAARYESRRKSYLKKRAEAPLATKPSVRTMRPAAVAPEVFRRRKGETAVQRYYRLNGGAV